jgi:hypothetical protein
MPGDFTSYVTSRKHMHKTGQMYDTVGSVEPPIKDNAVQYSLDLSLPLLSKAKPLPFRALHIE